MKSHGEFFADKLMDLANLAAAALIFGQMLNVRIYAEVRVLGFAFYLLCVVVSYEWNKRRECS